MTVYLLNRRERLHSIAVRTCNIAHYSYRLYRAIEWASQIYQTITNSQ